MASTGPPDTASISGGASIKALMAMVRSGTGPGAAPSTAARISSTVGTSEGPAPTAITIGGPSLMIMRKCSVSSVGLICSSNVSTRATRSAMVPMSAPSRKCATYNPAHSVSCLVPTLWSSKSRLVRTTSAA